MEQSFTKPFQSSGGICYPSTDYSKYYSQQQQKGGSGAYSKDSLIPNLPGKDMYVAPQFERKLDSTFYKENLGVDYATAFGGKRRRRSTSKSKKTTKKKTTKKKTTKRKMRGGSVTGLPSSYFNASAPVASYGSDSGKGMMTAYGPTDPKDIGQGLLAPYNANPAGNQASMMKTGGKKRTSRSRSSSRSRTTKGKKKTTKKRSSSKRKMKGGFARVPKMSDSAVTGVQKVVGGTVDTLNSFMKNLETKFNQSVKASENVKIGEQRLIQQQGGKKKKRSTSKSKKPKKTSTKRRRSMKGGNGSDYSTTINSRGPANYPDNGWYKGEQLFRQFSKSGEYIPNSQLPYAAAPISTMSNPNPQNIITGFDNLGQPWAPIGK